MLAWAARLYPRTRLRIWRHWSRSHLSWRLPGLTLFNHVFYPAIWGSEFRNTEDPARMIGIARKLHHPTESASTRRCRLVGLICTPGVSSIAPSSEFLVLEPSCHVLVSRPFSKRAPPLIERPLTAPLSNRNWLRLIGYRQRVTLMCVYLCRPVYSGH